MGELKRAAEEVIELVANNGSLLGADSLWIQHTKAFAKYKERCGNWATTLEGERSLFKCLCEGPPGGTGGDVLSNSNVIDLDEKLKEFDKRMSEKKPGQQTPAITVTMTETSSLEEGWRVGIMIPSTNPLGQRQTFIHNKVYKVVRVRPSGKVTLKPVIEGKEK